MQTRTVCLKEFNLCYRALGAGPDVLFLHGWTSSGQMWEAAMQALAPRFRCWAIDLFGFGDSDKPLNGAYSIPNYTASIRAFAGALDIESASVVGHSMGGMIALDLAGKHGEFVRRLVVVNPVVRGRLRAYLHLFLNHIPDQRLLAITRRFWPRTSRLVRHHPVGRWLEARRIWHNREDLSKATPESAVGGLRALLRYDTTPVLPRISAPTLVVVGRYDPAVPPSEGRRAAERIPGAQFKMFPLGHQVANDRPDEFNALLASFLASPN